MPIKKPWRYRVVFASPSYSSLTAVRSRLSQIDQCDLGSAQRVNALHASHERLPDVHALLSEAGGFTAYSKRDRDRPADACVQFVDWIGRQMGISGGRAGVVVTEEQVNPRQRLPLGRAEAAIRAAQVVQAHMTEAGFLTDPPPGLLGIDEMLAQVGIVANRSMAR